MQYWFGKVHKQVIVIIFTNIFIYFVFHIYCYQITRAKQWFKHVTKILVGTKKSLEWYFEGASLVDVDFCFDFLGQIGTHSKIMFAI